ncbi:MAG: HAD-IA family hydrolase [Kiloniellaceae bacterium]
MAKRLASFRYMTFDVVGTLIDFEAGLVAALREIAAEQNAALDGERALAFYRAARYMPEALRFPDDLERAYMVIAPQLGLTADPALASRLRASVASWQPFADSVAVLASLKQRHRLIAMTNAQRWAFDHFDDALGSPFHAAFTVDDTATEKPDPAFFKKVFAFIEREGGSPGDILHVAQSQYHDIGVSRQLGLTNCWIERRHDRPGYGGTIEPSAFTVPDYHFTSLAALAEAANKEAA